MNKFIIGWQYNAKSIPPPQFKKVVPISYTGLIYKGEVFDFKAETILHEFLNGNEHVFFDDDFVNTETAIANSVIVSAIDL